MPTYTPTTTGSWSISGNTYYYNGVGITMENNDWSYQAFLFHLLANNYKIKELYLQTTTLSQLIKPFIYKFIINETGAAKEEPIIPVIPPQQKIGNILPIDLSEKDVWLGKQGVLTLSTIKAGETVSISFYLDDKMNDFKLVPEIIERGGVFCNKINS